jgi:hypothetical protein
MIRVEVKYGSGDRKAAVISDPLITDDASAMMRAKQELAEFTYIKMSRTLNVPHDPRAGINGDVTEEFAYSPLGIYGSHIIMSRTMNFSPESATDDVSIEQYREMIL